jgi:hypothetical protein
MSYINYLEFKELSLSLTTATIYVMILGNGKQNKNKRDNYYDEYCIPII